MLSRIAVVILISHLSFSAFAQEKKYQSLLWEISGNGLTKKSYMYGTMHVSEKVSYHLSDAFFSKLMEADMVANESDPETWTDMPDVYGGYYGKQSRGFYTNFYIKELVKNDLYPLFIGTNYTLTGLLSRTDEMNKEYQEDTYLDMFIYRTGRKYGKKSLGLEDATTSMVNIMKGQAIIDRRNVEDNAQNLKKFLKNKDQNEAMMDFYRDKDLDMLDSLMTLSSPTPYLKALLYDRNIVMVNSMDSLMKKGSLFAAVGAAHLAGPKGMIEELRSRGYTVTAVLGDYTELGKGKKKQIEELFINPILEVKQSSDKMISIPLFKTVIESGENFESADLANGGFINVKRMLLKDFVKVDNKKFDHKTLDSLFYENIPGEILEKKFYEEKNYLVYDIKSKTKTNNAQHYRYYITPLEIIAVIMGGEGEYVRKFESLVYDKIVVKDYTVGMQTFKPIKGGFELNIPEYSTLIGNKSLDKSYSDIEVYGYNKVEDANYFLIENTLADKDDLIDTEFELKRIHYEFYNQFDADTSNTIYNTEQKRFQSQSKIGDKTVHLMSMLNGDKYYLIGTVNASKENSVKYFNSFKIKPFNSSVETMMYKDSSGMFSIEIPKKANENLNYQFEQVYVDDEEEKNHFVAKSERYSFASPSGQEVNLSFYRYHKYGSEKNIDSIWNDFKKYIRRDYENSERENESAVDENIEGVEAQEEGVNKKKKAYYVSRWGEELESDKFDKSNLVELIDEKFSFNENKSVQVIDVVATRPKSQQAIKYRGFVMDGATYLLKAMVPKGYQSDDAFIEKTFSSFKIVDTILTPSMYENKFDYFVQDANSEYDSIRYSALKSIDFLEVEKEDLPKLKSFLEEFQFENEEFESQLSLYRKIGELKDPSTIPYLEKIYKDENVPAAIQLAVLNALSYQEGKQGYRSILKLLEYDLPLSDNQYDISSLFSTFSYDLEHSQVLFPDLFQFYGVKEYARPVMTFTNSVLNAGLGTPKKMKAYKKMILTNAKLEYKRVLSWVQSQETQESDRYDYFNSSQNAPVGELTNYLNILYAFKKEQEVAKLFAKVDQLELDEINLNNAKMELNRNNSIDDELLNTLLNKSETKFDAFQIMKQTNQTVKLNQFSSDTIAFYGLMNLNNLNPESDSIEFLEKRVVTHKGKELEYYFYKTVNIEQDSYNKNDERLACVAFVSKNGKINPQAFRTFRGQSILEDKEIAEYIKATIDESLNNQQERATFRKIKSSNFGYGDFYFEEPYFEGDFPDMDFPEEEYYEGEYYEEY